MSSTEALTWIMKHDIILLFIWLVFPSAMYKLKFSNAKVIG